MNAPAFPAFLSEEKALDHARTKAERDVLAKAVRLFLEANDAGFFGSTFKHGTGRESIYITTLRDAIQQVRHD